MKKLILRTLVAILLLQALLLVSPSPAYAEDMTCPEHTPVTIDIKPSETPNKINLSARGLLPVALLTTRDFNASQFVPQMAHLSDASMAMTTGCAGADAVRWNYDDVDRDGDLDLVFFFNVQDLNLYLSKSSTAAALMAHDAAEVHIMGTDSVIVKP